MVRRGDIWVSVVAAVAVLAVLAGCGGPGQPSGGGLLPTARPVSSSGSSGSSGSAGGPPSTVPPAMTSHPVTVTGPATVVPSVVSPRNPTTDTSSSGTDGASTGLTVPSSTGKAVTATTTVPTTTVPTTATTTGPATGRPASTSTSTSSATRPPSSPPPGKPPTAPPGKTQPGSWPLTGASDTSPLSILPGSNGRRVVALTFDDGPGPYTHQILDVLAAKHVHATFCQIGRQVGDYLQTERRIVAEGNSLCNHSWDHIYARTTAAATIPEEIDRTNAAIAGDCGVRPRLMRAPGGLWTPALFAALRARHMVPLGWAVDPDDWKEPGTATIVSRVLAQVQPGAVILMHDGGGNRDQTVAALATIIDTLRSRGYSFVTL